MNLLLTVRNLDRDEKLKNFIEQKSEKLTKYLAHNFNLTMNIVGEHNLAYVEVKASGFRGPVIYAKANTENVFESIDIAMAKLARQVRNMSNKRKKRQKVKKLHT